MKNNEKPFKDVCVIGLGYIGLPTASMFATHGFRVHGVDVNPVVIQTLQEGHLHIEEPGLATVVKAAIGSKNLIVGSKPIEADVFIIAVPTPYQHAGGDIPTADMSFVRSATDSILPFLRNGNLVILESTSPPGTTRDLIIPMIEKKGFKVGSDIGVAYCPERVIPGQALKELISNDRIVGAITAEWAEVTKALYKSFVSGEIFISEPTVAETVKLLENTFRDVNIALANEMAVICENLNINVWDVIRLANRHPRVNVHKPGPGVGGHCMSVDPWFIVEKFPGHSKLIQTARNVNDAMPDHVVELILDLVKATQKPKIALLGLTYKGNVDDIRESPAISVLKKLKKNSSLAVAYFDPHVNTMEFPRTSLDETLQGADVATVLSAHDNFLKLEPAKLAGLMRNRQILDTHNILKKDVWEAAGFAFKTLGNGHK